MNNTDKLLRVFIEASGYEIEEKEDIKRFYKRDDIMENGEPKENAMPDSIIKTVDYKVTKKSEADLLKALSRAIDIIEGEFSCVEPEILAAFEKAGGIR